ncbi:protein MIZU-KUSSEI 1-like [Gastrolobium bilobum]|uniref:protein MIZU-KUSSEI 1-like n=1 Tax=Gastrolobium bilobum TaxID=150636 RepID=UPI002AB114DF|nr:protein MIZU-KUSSEI 1-like [Gastrolobium bilobum]
MAPYMLPEPPRPPPPSSPISKEDCPDTNTTAAPEKHLSPLRASISLQPANSKNKHDSKSHKVFRKFRSIFRSFPIIVPSCKMPVMNGNRSNDMFIHGGTRITGTLFGHRKARVNIAFQENAKCEPFLLLELAIPTGKLFQDMGMGLNRIALECEKHQNNEKIKIVDEPIWTLFCNGKKTGYGVKREPTDDDLNVMQLLHAVSIAVGVLPNEMSDPHDGELSYMRAHFERVVGSRDSETYYMMMPHDGNNGPELSVFFVRV